jgi:hypothetical protein
LNDLEVVQRSEDLLLIAAQGGLAITGTDHDLLGLLLLVARAAGVAGVLFQQGAPGLSEAVALPPSGRGQPGHPGGDRTRILPGLVGGDDPIQLGQPPLQPGEIEQAMPRGVGGDDRAVERALGGRGQAPGHGPFQDLTVETQQQGPEPVAEVIPAVARGHDPQAQPEEAAAIAGIARPLGGRMMTGLDLVQDDLEHQIGAMGPRADAGIGGEQAGQIELIDGLIDDAGEMVHRQSIVDRNPFGRGAIPGRRGEAIESGKVARGRADGGQEVDLGSRSVGPALALRPRREYHDARLLWSKVQG